MYANAAHAWVRSRPWAKSEAIRIIGHNLPGDINGRKVGHLFIPIDRLPEWLDSLSPDSLTASKFRNTGQALSLLDLYKVGLYDAAVRHVREQAYRRQVKDEGVTVTNRLVRNIADQQQSQDVERRRLESFLTSMRLLADDGFYWQARDLIKYFGENEWSAFERHIHEAFRTIEKESSQERAELHLYKTQILTRRPQVIHDWYLSQFGCLHIALTYPGGRFDVQVARGYFKRDHSKDFPEQPVLPATEDKEGTFEVVPAEDDMDQRVSTFEASRQEDEQGEYWSARTLQNSYGYAKWQMFEAVIQRAIQAIDGALGVVGAGQDMITRVSNHVPRGFGGTQEQVDYRLTRYGAYMLAMECDGTKPEIGAAKTYFATQTHYAEQVQAGELAVTAPAEVEPYRPRETSVLDRATAGAEVNYRSAQALAALRDVVPKDRLEEAGLEIIESLRRTRESIEGL